MATSSVPLFLALFGAFVGALAGLITGWIVRRAAPTWSGISLRWIAAGWAAAWAIGLGIMGTLLAGASARDTALMAVAFGTSAIGGIGGGVTFWQIEQAHRRSSAVVVEMTTPAPKAVPLDKSIRQSIIVVCGGWIMSWVVGGVTWALNFSASFTVMVYFSWAGISLITGFVLRYVAPATAWKRIALIAIGWPLCLVVGTATAWQNNWTLPLGVAACGWLAASAFIPSIPGRNWLYGGVAAAAWTASWSIGGSSAWFSVLTLMNPGLTLQPNAVLLILGAILSGVIGGRVLYMLFVQARHELSTMEASPRSKEMLDETIARPIVALGGGWIALWALAVIVAQWFVTAEESITAGRASWIVVSLLTGFVLYRMAPNVQKYALLIALGWPLCLLIGTAIIPPTVTLPLAVAVCGLLAAWALSPLMPSIGWLQRLLAAGVWAGCWLISNGVWNTALRFVNFNGPSLVEFTGGRFSVFLGLTSGAIISSVLGGVVLYWLIDQARRKSSRVVASSEGNSQ